MILLSGFSDSSILIFIAIIVFFSFVIFAVPAIFLREKIHSVSRGHFFVKTLLYTLTYLLSNGIVYGIILLLEKLE
jgi:hypothetical protein